MSLKSRSELIRSIEAALDTRDFHSLLEAETLPVLTKLNTLPAATVRNLLERAANAAIYARLQTGPKPEDFDCCAVAEVNVLLWGPPGRGKSQLAEVLAKRHATRVSGTIEQIVCPEDTQVSMLAGSYQPAEGGAWQWVDGPVTRVLRTGGVCILDELAHLSPEASTWLLNATDRTSNITIPSGEVIAKQPVWFIATQNDTPSSLLPALQDRFPARNNVTLPFAWEWLGAYAPLAERDLTTQESASLRPWAALRRMTDAGVPLEQAVRVLWPDSPSQANAIKLALDNQ